MSDQLDVDGDDHPFDISPLFEQCEHAQEVEDAINNADSAFSRYAATLKQEAQAAMEKWVEIDPNDSSAVSRLQSIAGRYLHLCNWAANELKLGDEAANQISIHQQPVDLAPSFAIRDQEDELNDEHEDD